MNALDYKRMKERGTVEMIRLGSGTVAVQHPVYDPATGELHAIHQEVFDVLRVEVEIENLQTQIDNYLELLDDLRVAASKKSGEKFVPVKNQEPS